MKPKKQRDTELIWHALALVTQAANKDNVRIAVDPQDLEDMKAILARMSDQESTWQLVRMTDDPDSPEFIPRLRPL